MIRRFVRAAGFSVASDRAGMEGIYAAAREAVLSRADAAISFFTP